jgi:formylglycine-generating enzyme required for sulfatase activity
VGPRLDRTTAIGSYPANAFGLHDVHGNVWEWCADWFAADSYRRSPPNDPPGPPAAEGRVMRGGSWGQPGQMCRSAYRAVATAGGRGETFGFRVAMTVAAGV